MTDPNTRTGGLFPAGTWKYCLLLLAVFVVSRLLYHTAGVRFILDLDSLIQVADTQLLRDDTFRTVLLLHFQPPLFNLFAGLILNAFPSAYALVFQIIYLATGLLLMLGIFLLAVRLGLSRKLALILAAMFAVTPAFVLLENWAFYTLPVALILVLAALVLNIYLERHGIGWLFCLFFLLALLVLTRSMFHPLLMLLVPGIIFWLMPERRREIVTAAAVPVMLVGLWMAKNYYTVGNLTTSTLLGMNLYKITTMQLPDIERVRIYADGELSVYGLFANFESLDYYREKAGFDSQFAQTGIPVLDNEWTHGGNPNFNHPAYVDISKRFLQDDLRVIRHRPLHYLRGVLGALSLYLQPPHDQIFDERNIQQITPVSRVFDLLLYGQISTLWHDNHHTEFKARIDLGRTLPDIGLFVLIALLAVMVYWLPALAAGGRGGILSPRGGTIAFMLMLLVYVTLVANLIEIGENARIRFQVEPYLWLLFALCVARVRTLDGRKNGAG